MNSSEIFFEWLDEYSVKVKTLDEDHQKLAALINKMYQTLDTEKDNASLGEIFNESFYYTEHHFSKEEKLMEKYYYPFLPEHKKQHDKFLKNLTRLHSDYIDNKFIIRLDTLLFLTKWWTEHVMEHDMKYALFFNEQGVF
ncbi:MAG: bacteriohemerythrin [bacterium]